MLRNTMLWTVLMSAVSLCDVHAAEFFEGVETACDGETELPPSECPTSELPSAFEFRQDYHLQFHPNGAVRFGYLAKAYSNVRIGKRHFTLKQDRWVTMFEDGRVEGFADPDPVALTVGSRTLVPTSQMAFYHDGAVRFVGGTEAPIKIRLGNRWAESNSGISFYENGAVKDAWFTQPPAQVRLGQKTADIPQTNKYTQIALTPEGNLFSINTVEGSLILNVQHQPMILKEAVYLRGKSAYLLTRHADAEPIVLKSQTGNVIVKDLACIDSGDLVVQLDYCYRGAGGS